MVVNERDGLGDELAPDYLTHLEPAGFYGWPYAYSGRLPQPDYAHKRPDLVAEALTPDLLFRSHVAPIGLVFYDPAFLAPDAPARFPEAYHGDAFVAHKGSWNAAVPRGYMVVRVPFEGTRPKDYYEVFATGFRLNPELPGAGRARVWGRPAGITLAADGALIVAAEGSGSLWRIAPVP